MAGPVDDPIRREMKLFGLNVRRLRKRLGISQEELGFMSDLHRAYIGAVERGERNLTIENIIKISHSLNVSPAELFSDISEASDTVKALSYLCNRREFTRIVRDIERSGISSVGVVFGKINGLYLIRELCGAGKAGFFEEELFRKVKSLCGKEDILARWEDDEFVILMPYRVRRDELDAICGRIRGECDSFRERMFYCCISLGYSTGENGENRIDGLIRSARDEMNRDKLLRAHEIRRSMADFLGGLLLERDPEIASHSNRLKSIALKLGSRIGLSQKEMEELAFSSLLHDIGMIGLPNDLLQKRDVLLPGDMRIIQRHPEIGYRFMSSSDELSGLSEAILHHHERWDGGGYPEGLNKENIPLASRIIHIAEVFDILTVGCRYKKKVEPEEVIREISGQAGAQFDPELVKILIEMVSKLIASK